ncbi:MAG TPA: hypothetical protein ENI56_01415 [Candidatus Kaiserbacteria bacterium]|nr:hypothetical protein [Candidatus Kaiserbacteria bacterium]
MDDTQNNKDVQEITDKLNALAEEAKQLGADADKVSKRTDEMLNTIEADVDKSVQEIDEATADLDEADKEAGEDIDKLLIKQSEEIATQEKEVESE